MGSTTPGCLTSRRYLFLFLWLAVLQEFDNTSLSLSAWRRKVSQLPVRQRTCIERHCKTFFRCQQLCTPRERKMSCDAIVLYCRATIPPNNIMRLHCSQLALSELSHRNTCTEVPKRSKCSCGNITAVQLLARNQPRTDLYLYTTLISWQSEVRCTATIAYCGDAVPPHDIVGLCCFLLANQKFLKVRTLSGVVCSWAKLSKAAQCTQSTS